MEYSPRNNYKYYKRYCKTLLLEDDPQLIEEYKKVHAPGAAWPEITQGMREVGILDMEIYITGNRLFMIMDTVADFDHDRAMNELKKKPRQSEWETYVSKFQRTFADASADEKWELIERIYKMEESGEGALNGQDILIDAHHHFWKYDEKAYSWIDDSMDVLRQDYLPANLEHELSGMGVTGTVVVQARQTEEETRWLLNLAEDYSFIKGVVGWVDLRSAEVASRLEAFSDNPKLVGIRHVLHDEPDDDFMLQPGFIRGIGILQRFNLTYDLLLFPKHLQHAVKLVEMFPNQTFVLDHMAKPFIRKGIMHPWKEDLKALAKYPNVSCKISGMVTEADLNGWKYEHFVPYMEVVLEAFGPERIIVGSDWPVCLLAGEYAEVMSIPKRFFATLSSAERERIYSLNAIKCYNLNL